MRLAIRASILLAGVTFSIPAAPEEYPLGQVVEKVLCRAEPGQSYALFLPSRYDARQEWPVIFCFDPAARGRLPVGLFRDAAEQYGYILAGSNNSRNGTAGQGPESMRAMWNDVAVRFTIDKTRVYAAGMSGGARLICGFATRGDFLAGVISFAAGFPGSQAPKQGRFLFFGAAGVDDFNFPEMRQLDGKLEKLGATKRIVTFDGGHGWPPASVCAQAVKWLELQSMKSGRRPRDSEFIEKLFEEDRSAIRTAEAASTIGQVFLLTKALVHDFAGLSDVSSYEVRAARLAASREVKKYFQAEREEQSEQLRLQSELVARWSDQFDADSAAGARSSFAQPLMELKRQSEGASDSSRRRVARRVLNGCYVSANEQSRSLLEQKKYPASARMLELAVSIFPDRPQALYTLSSIYARAGDRKKALDALKRASEHGFRDAAAVEAEASFDFFRNDPRLKKLLEAIRR